MGEQSRQAARRSYCPLTSPALILTKAWHSLAPDCQTHASAGTWDTVQHKIMDHTPRSQASLHVARSSGVLEQLMVLHPPGDKVEWA